MHKRNFESNHRTGWPHWGRPFAFEDTELMILDQADLGQATH